MTRKKDEWITIAQAAVIAGCSYQTARNRALRAHGKRKKEGARWYVRKSWAESLIVGRGGRTAAAQVAGLKARVKAAEKERDQAITARDKWAADHARQRKEIEALKLELQTYADTYAESKPPAVIDRLVSAVESAPLETLMQIDQPRHAALRRVVGLWTAVQHAVESFTPGDSAQITNNDEEVT